MSGARLLLTGLLAVAVVTSLVPGAVMATEGPTAGPGQHQNSGIAGTGVDAGFGPAKGQTRLAAQDTSGSFSASTYRVTRGDAVEITFSHSDDATLYVGDEEAGYRLRVNVSGSGTSTVTIHTYDSTSSNPNDYVDGGDATLLYPDGGLSESLAATNYNLNLTVAGVPQDLGMLVIEEREPASLGAHIAPRELDRIEASHGDVAEAMSPGNTVARGDYAIIEVNASSLGDAIDSNNLAGGSTAAGIHLRFDDQEPEPNEEGDSFSVRSGSDGVRTYWDEDDTNLLVVWDTADVSLQGGSHTYNVTLGIEAEHNNLIEADTHEDNLTVTVVRPEVDLETDSGELTVYPWEEDVISLRGTTNYAPGTIFEFRARAFEPRPFLKKSTATVTENGTYETEMDFAGEARGISVPLWIHTMRDLGEWEVRLRAPNATFDIHNQTVETGETVKVENVSLGVGGFLVVSDLNGTVRGVSAPIGEGPVRTRNISLSPPLDRSTYLEVTAVMDMNENGTFDPNLDRPYPKNWTTAAIDNRTGDATQRAVVFVPETGDPRQPDAVNNTTQTRTNTTTTTTVTGTPTVTTLAVEAEEPLTPGTTSGDADLSLALPVVAILALALLARRRQT